MSPWKRSWMFYELFQNMELPTMGTINCEGKPGSQRKSGWCSRRWQKAKRTLETEILASSSVRCASCLGNLNSLSVFATLEARRVNADQVKLKMTTDLKSATSSLNEYRFLLLLERMACNDLADDCFSFKNLPPNAAKLVLARQVLVTKCSTFSYYLKKIYYISKMFIIYLKNVHIISQQNLLYLDRN